jgi:hypothetical protein
MWLVAAVAVALLVAPWVIVLVLVRHHHLDDTAVGILAAVSIPLSGLWLTWVTLAKGGGSGTPASGPSLAQAIDQLAAAVGSQWEAEAAIRRLNDPYPLPVCWITADASLTDSWDSLVRLAASGVGRTQPADVGTWAACPDELAGEGSELADVLARVPTRRLAVLGEFGTGKTMLMIRLVLDLLARRAAGDPVPFLVSIATWNPAEQDLRDWLGARLLIDYPALGSPPPVGGTEPTQAAALLASGLIVPLLDGLDEIPEQLRGQAISRINDALRADEQIVVTCRTKEYQDAVRPKYGVEVTFRGAAAIQLSTLDADTVGGYLCADAGGPSVRARWEPVLKVLGTESPVGQALTTPLMVGLARAIYNPRPGELTETLPDPADLCSSDLTDQTAVESLLFDAFVPAAYRHNLSGRWTAKDAENWLTFLARYLEYQISGPNLAWWELPLVMRHPARWYGAIFGMLLGIGAGIVFGAVSGAYFDVKVAVAIGAGMGLVFGIYMAVAMVGEVRAALPKPTQGFSLAPSLLTIKIGVLSGGVAGVTLGIVKSNVVIGIIAGIASAGLIVVWGSLVNQSVVFATSSAASPSAILTRDRRSAGVSATVSAAIAGVTSGVLAGVFVGPATGLLVGVGMAISMAEYSGPSLTPWQTYEVTRIWLAARHRLPWPLMGFLEDAHRRGVLRQAGAVYQFRHIELQRRLARR